MDKLMEEEDLKGLEEEIDNAVDRLFVERKSDREDPFLTESTVIEPSSKPSASKPSMMPPVLEPPMTPRSSEPTKSPILESSVKSAPAETFIKSPPLEPSLESFLLEPSYELGKNLDLEEPIDAPVVSPAPPATAPPIPFLKSIERMEAQLLSLEWEITGEKLEKTREEISALKELLKQKVDMTMILASMEEVVSRMTQDEADIRPPWIKFLLDAKDTIKLLMRKETGAEINIYKQLALLGIEARFSCLEGMKDSEISPPSFKEGEAQSPGHSFPGEKKIEEISKSVDVFMKRVEEIFGTIQQRIFQLEETSRKIPTASVEAKSPGIPAIHVTIFKIDERLFGVESEKVFKLFRVPHTFDEKFSDQEKIRLRDLEVKIIDLKKLLAIEAVGRKEQIRILTVKENGGYKGFMVDEVLKRVSILSERRGEAGEYFSGVIPFTYQGQAVEIPILDLTKF